MPIEDLGQMGRINTVMALARQHFPDCECHFKPAYFDIPIGAEFGIYFVEKKWWGANKSRTVASGFWGHRALEEAWEDIRINAYDRTRIDQVRAFAKSVEQASGKTVTLLIEYGTAK